MCLCPFLLQVISFYTWQQHLAPAELQAAINQQLQAAIPTKHPLHSSSSSSSSGRALPADCQAHVWHVAAADREFHATFSAHWRRYVYLLPLRQQQQQQQQDQHNAQQQQRQLETALQEADVEPARVDALLQQLQGRRLNYTAYARDTPRGKGCECTLHVARASLVRLPATASGQGVPCLCIELAGDRFLRRMVRVLVATAVREALLLQRGHAATGCAGGMDRQATAPPAPALGLCFAAVGYS
ncbi:hypothetical protein COO60DRAFT_1269072 [Scenedesmus sp. NREL 46B-D3]|nr:hypothetical protein COO60DRAFT_1269072 [Scenedesmus sp. NREL 46B-D3]